MKKIFLFVTTGANGFYRIEWQCEATSHKAAQVAFESRGERLCMNTAIIALDSIPNADKPLSFDSKEIAPTSPGFENSEIAFLCRD